MTPFIVFARYVEAITQGSLIERVSTTDKEYHFQNWFSRRLEETHSHFDIGGRNSYPDFRMVETTEGYELKGLAYPGRDATFDSNSQVPADSTTAGPFITSLAAIQRNRTATATPCSTLSSVTAIFSTPTMNIRTRIKALEDLEATATSLSAIGKCTSCRRPSAWSMAWHTDKRLSYLPM